MKYLPTFVVSVALSLTASAAVIPRQSAQNCFSLVTKGEHATEFAFVQIDPLGLNYIGSKNPQGVYCLDGATISTPNNKICFVNPASKVFQCGEAGAADASNLALADGKILTFKGSSVWWACKKPGATADGSSNLYSNELGESHTSQCKKVEITAMPSSSPPGSPASDASPTLTTTSTTAQVATAAPTDENAVAIPEPPVAPKNPASCPTDISGKFLAPNLIVPVSSANPNTAYGTQYTASISSANSTIFAFDIPPSEPYTGTCALIFLFPFGNKAQFPYVFTGIEREQLSHGGLTFALLSSPVSESTTFATLPSVQTDYGKTQILPGNGYSIATYQCQSGQKVSYKVSADGDVGLTFFEATAKSPLGLFVVPCA